MVWGVQLEKGTVATDYQDTTDVLGDVIHVPSLHYLQFDGVDDELQAGGFTLSGNAPSHMALGALILDSSGENRGAVTYGVGSGNGSRAIDFTNSKLKVDTGGNNAPLIPYDESVPHVFEGTFGTTVQSAVDGGNFGSSGTSVGTNSGSLFLGKGIVNNFLAHKNYGLVVPHRILSTHERDRLVALLKTKTGIMK
jgi:hypothetical protein